MAKIALSDFIPPIVPRLVKKLARDSGNDQSELFDGDMQLFVETVKNSRVYGEYGCGFSTNWVLANTSAQIKSIDSSEEWLQKVRSEATLDALSKLKTKFVDLGALGNWGRPLTYTMRHKFSVYTDWIWGQVDKPDVVLIDGRFRVCCFLTTLLNADSGTKILFDDYTNRAQYHVVENYAKRAEECGRQCLFVVPSSKDLDQDAVASEIINFRHVMD